MQFWDFFDTWNGHVTNYYVRNYQLLIISVATNMVPIRSPSWPVWSPTLSPPPATPPPSQPPTPVWSSPRSRFWSLRQSKSQHQQSPQVCTHQDIFRTPDNKQTGFRFPPWSGPSPRTHSSPGLLPLTPDSLR